RRHRLLLPPHAGLLVVLALAQLREDAGLLALLLEAADGALDGLVLLDPNPCHVVTSPPPKASGTPTITARPPRRQARTIRQKAEPVKGKGRSTAEDGCVTRAGHCARIAPGSP